MQKVIGVRFKTAGKINLFDPGEEEIQRGDFVIVETARGIECGEVVVGVKEIPIAEDSANVPAPRPIQRKATPADLAKLEENHEREKRAFDICLEKIAEHELPMNLISVTYTFDLNKLIFHFTAEGRVDFRALVRDLAYIFHTRIELRQVGVREEAKFLGGIGCCGRALCCATFLGDFAPVSIRMAKEQNLSLNPTKISGICGRLLCCLKYESDYYHQAYVEHVQNYHPKSGDRVVIEDGISGRIISVNESRRNVTVLLDSGDNKVVGWDAVFPVDAEESPAEVSKLVEETKIEEPPVEPKRRERVDKKERPERSKTPRPKKSKKDAKKNER